MWGTLHASDCWHWKNDLFVSLLNISSLFICSLFSSMADITFQGALYMVHYGYCTLHWWNDASTMVFNELDISDRAILVPSRRVILSYNWHRKIKLAIHKHNSNLEDLFIFSVPDASNALHMAIIIMPGHKCNIVWWSLMFDFTWNYFRKKSEEK